MTFKSLKMKTLFYANNEDVKKSALIGWLQKLWLKESTVYFVESLHFSNNKFG